MEYVAGQICYYKTHSKYHMSLQVFPTILVICMRAHCYGHKRLLNNSKKHMEWMSCAVGSPKTCIMGICSTLKCFYLFIENKKIVLLLLKNKNKSQ